MFMPWKGGCGSKSPRLKGRSSEAQEVERHLRQSAGIEDVSANPTTGNVLIHYNSRLIDQEDIIFSLKEVGYLSHPSHRGSGNNPSSDPHGVVGKVTSTVAATLMEFALSRLVSALI